MEKNLLREKAPPFHPLPHPNAMCLRLLYYRLKNSGIRYVQSNVQRYTLFLVQFGQYDSRRQMFMGLFKLAFASLWVTHIKDALINNTP